MRVSNVKCEATSFMNGILTTGRRSNGRIYEYHMATMHEMFNGGDHNIFALRKDNYA